MKTLLLLTSLFFMSFDVWTQEEHEPLSHITCASDDNLKKRPTLGATYEAAYRKAVVNYYDKGIRALKNGEVFTIPTVVHIIHDGSPLGTDVNRTDDQIRSQIQQASDRFRHQQPGAKTYTNPNYGVDTEIELCLATLDPSGNYTSGILRYYDPINTIDPSFDYMDNLAWDKSLYNNIFIARDIGGACGYANGSFTVYLASCFNPGLTAHELGHHFSLRHTFTGNGSNPGACDNDNCLEQGDLVCDTPAKNVASFNGGSCDDPNNTCTTDDDDLSSNNPYRPVANGGLGDQPDMLENFMDYTGSCWDAFTLGQKVRMHFNLTNSRVALYGNSAACSGPSMAAHDAGVSAITVLQSDACDRSIEVGGVINNYGMQVLTSVVVDILIDGELRGSQTYSSLDVASGASTTLTFATPFTITTTDKLLELRTRLPNNTTDANVNNDGNYSVVTYIGGDYCLDFSASANINTASASGPGNTTVVTLNNDFPELPGSGSSVEMCVSVQGDANWRLEVYSVITETMETLGITNFGVDCEEPTPQKCFLLSQSDYNLFKSDGTISVSFDPVSTEINPTLCNINQVFVSLKIPQSDGCDADAFPALVGPYSDAYSAAQYIRTTGVVESQQTVLFQARDSVMLGAPFMVSDNAVLEILMEDCND